MPEAGGRLRVEPVTDGVIAVLFHKKRRAHGIEQRHIFHSGFSKYRHDEILREINVQLRHDRHVKTVYKLTEQSGHPLSEIIRPDEASHVEKVKLYAVGAAFGKPLARSEPLGRLKA